MSRHQASVKILERLQGVSRGDFNDNDLLQDGIIRQMEVIGEAAARLSETFRKKHRDVDVAGMKGFRNVLIHGCAEVNLDQVWIIAHEDIPVLLGQLRPLIHREPENS